MMRIPSVQAPQDFDGDVAVRTLLASMPIVPAPEAFEADVQRRLRRANSEQHRPRGILWWLLGMLVTMAGLVVLGVYYARPDEVEVVRVPDVMTVTDIENLPPVAVQEDLRWRHAASNQRQKHTRWPKVVAGY